MDLDTMMIAVFCLVDDALKTLFRGNGLRQRGPKPTLADSEVITMEVVGEHLGLNQDKALFGYFRRHFSHFFPALCRVNRTTFVRQAANLWQIKHVVWQHILWLVSYDSSLALVDSFPLPVCQFARAYRCRLFKGEAAFGKDLLVRQTFYGFRLHFRVCWPGVITRLYLTPANIHELAAVPDLVEGSKGLTVGDRNYWAPLLQEELQGHGVTLLSPFRCASRDPQPQRSSLLSHFRYRIDTVFSQLVERYHAKQVGARDVWHLVSRILRKVLAHSIALLLNANQGNAPLHLAELLS